MSHQLPVGGVVDRLDADDFGLQRVVLLGQEPEKLQLGRRRSDEQNLPSVSKHGGNVPEELGTVVGVLVLRRRAFGMPMEMVLGRGDRFRLELFCVEAKNARLLMVEPYDGLMSDHEGPQSKGRANRFDPASRRQTTLLAR